MGLRSDSTALARPDSKWSSVACVGAVPGERDQVTLLALLAPPVVHQLVASDADQVADVDRGEGAGVDVVDRGEDRFGGEILGECPPAAATQDVGVKFGHRAVDVVDERIGAHSIETCVLAHVPLIVAGALFPNITTCERVQSKSPSTRFWTGGVRN